MPLASHRPQPHARSAYAAVAAAALALVAAPRTAAADPPPSDLPPVGGAPVASPAPAPVPAPAPTPPTTPVRPPIEPFAPFAGVGAPPGLMTTPPGYAAPYPWAPPMVQAPANVALPPLPPRRYNSPSLFAGGVTAVVVGMSTVLVGSYFVASAPGRIEIYCDTPSFPCAYKTDAQRLTGGAIMMTAGTLIAVAGIPMWFIGARRVVDEKKAAAQPVDVRVGAGTASLSVRF